MASYRARALDEAKRLFAEAVRTDPKLALGYIALAQFHATPHLTVVASDGRVYIVPRSDATDTASLLLRRAFQINPFIEVHPPWEGDLPYFWVNTLKQALRHYHQGDFAPALEGFGTVIARSRKPGRPEAVPPVALWYHLLTAVQMHLYEDAIKDGQELLAAAQKVAEKEQNASDGRVGDIQYVLADLNRAAGHSSVAEDLYQQVVQNNLGFYMAHARLAELYQEQSRWDEAVLERRRAIDANPEDPSLTFDLGLTLANAGNNSEAERVLLAAAQGNPRETRVAYVFGLVQVQLGNVAEARTAFTKFLALAPMRYSSMRADAQQRLASLQ
jgi:tetratricopeptide (TPR) repeat protein